MSDENCGGTAVSLGPARSLLGEARSARYHNNGTVHAAKKKSGGKAAMNAVQRVKAKRQQQQQQQQQRYKRSPRSSPRMTKRKTTARNVLSSPRLKLLRTPPTLPRRVVSLQPCTEATAQAERVAARYAAATEHASGVLATVRVSAVSALQQRAARNAELVTVCASFTADATTVQCVKSAHAVYGLYRTLRRTLPTTVPLPRPPQPQRRRAPRCSRVASLRGAAASDTSACAPATGDKDEAFQLTAAFLEAAIRHAWHHHDVRRFFGRK